MKWYLALSEKSVEDAQYSDLLRVSLVSGLERTNLRPFLLWDGQETELTRSLRRVGVTIVPCVSRFLDLINRRWSTDERTRRIAMGAFMRLEIPSLEQEEEFVLYTDCDVMFTKNPKLSSYRPEFFSVAPEFDIGNYDDMNTGVIIMNVPAMLREQKDFDKYIRENFFSFSTFDQSALKSYFSGRFDFLPPTLNWKPYWGPAHSAEVIHFHLKPYHIRVMADHPDVAALAGLRPLYLQHPKFCQTITDQWYSLLEKSRSIIFSEGESPSLGATGNWPKDFDGDEYLRIYPDVANARLNPFEHYLVFGASEGRRRPTR